VAAGVVADEDSDIDDTNANLRAWLRTGPNYDDDRPINDVHEEETTLEKLDDRWIGDLRQEKTTQEISDEPAATKPGIGHGTSDPSSSQLDSPRRSRRCDRRRVSITSHISS
jgi:hypothetical protein